jgi:hypothetical protein
LINDERKYHYEDKRAHTSRETGSAKSEAAQDVQSGVFKSCAHPVSNLPIPALSVVKRLPSPVEHRAITCGWLVETPAISTHL